MLWFYIYRIKRNHFWKIKGSQAKHLILPDNMWSLFTQFSRRRLLCSICQNRWSTRSIISTDLCCEDKILPFTLPPNWSKLFCWKTPGLSIHQLTYHPFLKWEDRSWWKNVYKQRKFFSFTFSIPVQGLGNRKSSPYHCSKLNINI